MILSVLANAQVEKTIVEMEAAHKNCLDIHPDSSGCSKKFLIQIDSMQNVVFEKIILQIDASEKSSFIQNQLTWAKKKKEFFKKQEETFVYNLQEGIWEKDMIRISYQQKAEFILKRIRVLLKRLVE